MTSKAGAAHLSDCVFIRATSLLEQIRAEQPHLTFMLACEQALRQAWIEDRESRASVDWGPSQASCQCPA
ncbi:MAG: hypothetical protein ABSD27_15700 [Bryobacteraceae bacterium]